MPRWRPMIGPSEILLLFLVPATLAGLALMIGARSEPPGRRIGALGVGCGFLGGYLGLFGELPALPPHDAGQGLFYVVLAATLAAWFEGSGRAGPLARLPLRVLVATLAPLLYLKNLVKNWNGDEVLEHVGPIALAILIVWSGMDALARKRPGATVPLSFWLAATGASVGLLISTFAVNSQLAGTLAAILGAATVASWIWPRATLAGGAAGVVAVTLAMLCAGGVHLSALPPFAGLALVLAPLAAWLGELLGAGRMSPRKAVLLRLALVALPVLAGLWIAWEQRPPPDPYADY